MKAGPWTKFTANEKPPAAMAGTRAELTSETDVQVEVQPHVFDPLLIGG